MQECQETCAARKGFYLRVESSRDEAFPTWQKMVKTQSNDGYQFLPRSTVAMPPGYSSSRPFRLSLLSFSLAVKRSVKLNTNRDRVAIVTAAYLVFRRARSTIIAKARMPILNCGSLTELDESMTYVTSYWVGRRNVCLLKRRTLSGSRSRKYFISFRADSMGGGIFCSSGKVK